MCQPSRETSCVDGGDDGAISCVNGDLHGGDDGSDDGVDDGVVLFYSRNVFIRSHGYEVRCNVVPTSISGLELQGVVNSLSGSL